MQESFITTSKWVICLMGLTSAACAVAQQYPTRPLRIVVPFAAGGGSDVVARLIAQKLTESLGQTVIVDNRPGAGANIGIGIAAKAAPDGYTLLVASSAFTVNPTLYSRIPYDPIRDFQPITCIGSSPNMLAVHHSGDRNARRARALDYTRIRNYSEYAETIRRADQGRHRALGKSDT